MQLSRMGMGAGFSDLVEEGTVGVGGGEDGDSSEEYDSDVDTGGGKAEASETTESVSYSLAAVMAAGIATDKSPTAKDFADIAELAEEAEGATPLSSQMERQGFGEGEGRDALFRKGMAFARSLPGGSGLSAVSMETDDYDDDSEEVPGSQPLPSNTNEEELPLSQQPDSGYESLPLSDPASSLDPSDHTPQVTAASEATPTSLSKLEGEEGGREGGNIESAIPYLIPKDMTLEQLHAKVHTHIHSSILWRDP